MSIISTIRTKTTCLSISSLQINILPVLLFSKRIWTSSENYMMKMLPLISTFSEKSLGKAFLKVTLDILHNFDHFE